jgi:hypothetical protein
VCILDQGETMFGIYLFPPLRGYCSVHHSLWVDLRMIDTKLILATGCPQMYTSLFGSLSDRLVSIQIPMLLWCSAFIHTNGF